jgi:FAD/FMN-containing dehydrogenase
VIGVELVNAQGELIYANAEQNADLYWAHRGGGGGNFGIVTAFDFTVNPIGTVAVCNITWTWDAFMEVAGTFQQFAPNAPDALSTFLRFSVNAAPELNTITLFGQLTPDSPADLMRVRELIMPMLSAAPPIGVQVQAMPYSAAAAFFAGADPKKPEWMLHPHNDTQLFKSTSAVAYKPFSTDALTLLKSQIESAPAQQDWDTNEPSMIQLLAGGGAPGRVPVDGTAVPHREAAFVVQYDAYWTDPADQPVAEKWIEGVRTAMLPHAQNAYVNYVDRWIEDYLDAYYVTNLPRLIDVKRAVDPENVFSFEQSIPTSPPPKKT